MQGHVMRKRGPDWAGGDKWQSSAARDRAQIGCQHSRALLEPCNSDSPSPLKAYSHQNSHYRIREIGITKRKKRKRRKKEREKERKQSEHNFEWKIWSLTDIDHQHIDTSLRHTAVFIHIHYRTLLILSTASAHNNIPANCFAFTFILQNVLILNLSILFEDLSSREK